mgnify:CR=1 FL=1
MQMCLKIYIYWVVILIRHYVGTRQMVNFWTNLVLGLALTLPLGPVTLEILQRGIRKGFREAIATAAGAFCAEAAYFVIVLAGFYRIFEYDIIASGIGIFGVCFLAYLAYQSIRDFWRFDPTTEQSRTAPFLSGFSITFFNPMNLILWLGIIGASFAAEPSLVVTFGVLVGILVAFLCVAGLGPLAGSALKRHHMRYVSLIAGIFLAYYAVRLLLSIV